jgi:hypothetical protein
MVELEVQRADAATRGLFKRAKSLLTREETLVDDAGRSEISQLVGVSPMLKTSMSCASSYRVYGRSAAVMPKNCCVHSNNGVSTRKRPAFMRCVSSSRI